MTTLQWIAHASCLISNGDYALLTDPWFLKKAFTSWTTKPPPIINPKLIIDMTKSGKIGIIISHHHFDHYDIDFIKQCAKDTPIIIADFSKHEKYNFPEVKTLYNSLKEHCLMENIIEIPVGENHTFTFGPFTIHKLRETSHDTIDSITTITTNDCFIVHGNDATGVPENSPAANILRKIKPADLPSVWMGQGGTANGWPLNYYCYTKEEKKEILNLKNLTLIKELKQTSEMFQFDKCLLYAHLSHVIINNYDIFKDFNYKPCSGKKANILMNETIFLDMHPSSIVLPAEDFRVIHLLHTLDHIECFEDNMRSTPYRQSYVFDSDMKNRLNTWLDALSVFCVEEHKKGNVADEDIDLIFKFVVVDEDVLPIFQRELKFINGTREVALKCDVTLIGNILDGILPFKDLSVGYLGSWSRTPKTYYNFNFMSRILAKQTHTYFGCNVLDL